MKPSKQNTSIPNKLCYIFFLEVGGIGGWPNHIYNGPPNPYYEQQRQRSYFFLMPVLVQDGNVYYGGAPPIPFRQPQYNPGPGAPMASLTQRNPLYNPSPNPPHTRVHF